MNYEIFTLAAPIVKCGIRKACGDIRSYRLGSALTFGLKIAPISAEMHNAEERRGNQAVQMAPIVHTCVALLRNMAKG
ncbi:MAG TPA: hypothetical protein VK699_11925 [Terriglobales bacterium]|jgi:hypothetical protein|nr:hypothetical protein [Terriglobales bacterium]